MSRSVGQMIAQLRGATAEQVAELRQLLGIDPGAGPAAAPRGRAQPPPRTQAPKPPGSSPPAPGGLREIPLEPAGPRPGAAGAARRARTYWELVVDATRARAGATGETLDPLATHWMMCVIACRSSGTAPPDMACPQETVAWFERTFHAHSPRAVVDDLARFVRGEVAPRPLDASMAHERQGAPPPDVPFLRFLRAETHDAGRGTVPGALRHLAAAAQSGRLSPAFADLDFQSDDLHRLTAEAALHIEVIWQNPEGKAWVVDHLRPYLQAHPCSWPPLEAEAIAGAPR